MIPPDDLQTPPTTVDAMIDDLADDGTVDSRGAFTLDTEVARQKMEQFQLADPLQYVLLLARAAVRQGATRADFRIDAEELNLHFDGRPLTHLDLAGLWSSLFDPEHRRGEVHGCGELAIALTAAQALGYKRIRVCSGDGERATALELRPGEPDALHRLEGEQAVRGTEVRVERKGGARVARAMADYAGILPEEELLRERCVYAPLALTIDGALQTTGLLLPHVSVAVDITGPGLHGKAGFAPGSLEPATLRILKDGIWIGSHELAEPAPGFVAVAEADALRTDLTQFNVVQDEVWAELVAAVERARREALTALVDYAREHRLWSGYDPAWGRHILGAALGPYRTRAAFEGEAADPLARILAEVPLWRGMETARRRGGRRTLSELLAHSAKGERVYWIDIPAEELAHDWDATLARLQEPHCLHLTDPASRTYLETLLGERFCDLQSADPERYRDLLAANRAGPAKELSGGSALAAAGTVIIVIAAILVLLAANAGLCGI